MYDPSFASMNCLKSISIHLFTVLLHKLMDFKHWILNEAMQQSTGKIRYGNNHAVLDLDSKNWREMYRYYRALVPKYLRMQPQMYDPHITFVRGYKGLGDEAELIEPIDPDLKKEFWGKYEGEVVPFEYDPELKTDGTMWWLDAFSKRLEDIREELGLSKMREPYDSFHITIGNAKEQE